jgi:hypothetical protein
MQSSFSEVVNPASYKTDGLDIDVPFRMHKSWMQEEKAVLMAQQDWSRSVYPLANYHGGLGSRYHFVSATIPDCLPERFHVIAYANEFAFLYDGNFVSLFTFQVLKPEQMIWRSWTSDPATTRRNPY